MTKDITRFLHQPEKHYAAALLLQGRPLLDADFNESARLFAEEQRRALIDITGGMGSPDDGFALGWRQFDHFSAIRLDSAFQVSPVNVVLGGENVPVLPVVLLPGSAYLGGMRFELDAEEHIAFQSEFLQATGDDLRDVSARPIRLYFLHAWEQAVTPVEDRELVEQALGGPDTTVRIRRLRRVELFDDFGSATPQTCGEAFRLLLDRLEGEGGEYDWNSGELRSAGRLQLTFAGDGDDDPCTPDPPAQYLGTENETLRLMLTGPRSFVWAIDNGAPLYRVSVTGLDGKNPAQIRVQMLTPPRDQQHRPREGQVVELLPFAALVDPDATPAPNDPHDNKLAAEIGVFTRVLGSFSEVDQGFGIEVPSSVRTALNRLITRWSSQDPRAAHLPTGGGARHFYLRLWHDTVSADDVELSFDGFGRGPRLGRSGIIPILHRAGRPGDSWTATLRIDQRDRILPYELLTLPGGVAPHGPRHFYMPVGLVNRVTGDVRDCRPRLRQLRDIGCETRTVGDGIRSRGDFKSIQEAIDSLPEEGGRVVVRPGVYREELLLREGVTLEGCGQETVLETPPGASQTGLIRLHHHEVKIRSLRIHAVEQRAIQADNASGLELSSLEVLAFRLTEDGVEPGSDASNEALIDLRDVDNSVLRGITIVPSRRQALLLRDCSRLRVEGLAAASDPETDETPFSPLIEIHGVRELKVREARLSSFGQLGIIVRDSVEVVLAELDVFVGAHTTGAPTRPGVNFHNSFDSVLERSRIVQEASPTEHAAITLWGTGITLRDNLVQSLPQCLDGTPPDDPEDCPLAVAWGGIQVRGGSQRIEILANRIRGGLGHGITLGSVLWGQSAFSASREEGAGKVQTTFDLEAEPPTAFADGNLAPGFDEDDGMGVQHFAAFNEGTLSDIWIAENDIENMASCGISVLTVLGLGESGDTDLIQIDGLRIERNTITRNLQQLPPESVIRSDVMPLSSARPDIPLDLQVLPWAGITLATVTSTTIANNQILLNASDNATLPICGLFVLNGDGIVIAKNRVEDNGRVPTGSDPLEPGLRAGIAVLLAGTDDASTTSAIDAELAVQSDPLEEARTLNQGERAGEFAVRVLDNVVRQPEGRGLYVVSTGMISIDGNFLGSQGFHGSSGDVDRLAIGDTVFVQGLGGAWETYNAGAFAGTSAGFDDFLAPANARGWLTNQFSPRLYVGAGGGVLFHNNQVVTDWEVKILPGVDEPLSFFPIVVLGQDHVGAIGNQCALRLAGLGGFDPVSGVPSVIPEVFLAHALIGGLTTQVARNRFAEPIASARVSLITSGEFFNITTLNLGTHPALAYRWKHPVSYNIGFDTPERSFSPSDDPRSFVFERNPALFVWNQEVGELESFFMDEVHNDSTLVQTIRAFFQLLNQRS